MDAKGRVDASEALGQRNRPLAGGKIGPDGDEPSHARVGRPAEHRIEIIRKRGGIEMHMGINRQCDVAYVVVFP